mgnify:CR=1 FL=1
MKTIKNLPFHLSPAAINEYCKRWGIHSLELFGSALRDDFGPASDVDFLYTLAPESKITLFDLVNMQDELAALVGRPVDLVSREAIEHSKNWLRKKEILSGAQPFYATTGR